MLTFSPTGAVLNILLPYWLTGDIHTVVANPESLSQPGSLLVLLVPDNYCGFMVALGAFWLYRFFGEAHFGEHAPLRWALFGVFSRLSQTTRLAAACRLGAGREEFCSLLGFCCLFPGALGGAITAE